MWTGPGLAALTREYIYEEECVLVYFFNFFMATSTKPACQKKLWIGNLDKRLTEYVLKS